MYFVAGSSVPPVWPRAMVQTVAHIAINIMKIATFLKSVSGTCGHATNRKLSCSNSWLHVGVVGGAVALSDSAQLSDIENTGSLLLL